MRNPELGWVFLAVRAPIEDTARALVETVPGARWERDCAKRHVEDGVFSCFVTRLVPAEWTLVLYGSAMLVKLALSQQIQAHAAAIARTLGVEVVAAIGKRAVAEYAADGTQAMHEYREDEVFYAGAKQEMLELFKERRIFVPPFAITTNGLTSSSCCTASPKSTSSGWVNPANPGESLHPDLNHPPPEGPHWDWNTPGGGRQRIYPDGTVVPK